MQAIANHIDTANRFLGKAAAWVAWAMLMFQVISVVVRYVFSLGLITFQEAVIYCHSILFLLGAAYVLQLNEHVRVDIFYGAVSPRVRKWIDGISLLFFVLPVSAVIIWVSWEYVARAWATFEGSRQAGGIPAIYLLKSTIIVFAISVGLQAIAILTRIFSGQPDPNWNSDPDATKTSD